MEVFIMATQCVLGLSLLIGLHELGHMLAAKAFGMRVEKYAIGFPPKIWSKKIGGTEYSIGAFLLGGFVKISGMVDESLDTNAMKSEPQPWEFRAKPAWQRLIVMLGGIIVNTITAVMIFTAIVYINGYNPPQSESSKESHVNKVYPSIGESFVKGVSMTGSIVAIQVQFMKKAFSGDIDSSDAFSSPIGLAEVYGGSWDWLRFWVITAALSMVLAFMNILPIPPLDGGRVLFIGYEIIAGNPLPRVVTENTTLIGGFIMLVLMVISVGSDIYKIIANAF